MGCGCGAGGSSSVPQYTESNNNIHQQTFIDDSCPYTVEILQMWLQKLECFKNNGLYVNMPNITVPQINSYTGTVLSALNYPSNVCYFKDMLDEVAPFITVIISTGLC